MPKNPALVAVYRKPFVKSAPEDTLCLEMEIFPGFQQCVRPPSLLHPPYNTVSFGADLHAYGLTVANCSPVLQLAPPFFWLSNPLSSP